MNLSFHFSFALLFSIHADKSHWSAWKLALNVSAPPLPSQKGNPLNADPSPGCQQVAGLTVLSWWVVQVRRNAVVMSEVWSLKCKKTPQKTWAYLSFTCMYMSPVLQVWNTITWSLQHLYPAHSWNFLVFAVFERHVWDLFKFFFFSATIRHLHVALQSLGQVNNVGVWVTLSETFFLSKKSSLYTQAIFFQCKRHRSSCSFLCSSNGPIQQVYLFFF